MFDWFRERREKNNIIEKFLMEHDLPDHPPNSKMPLNWDVNVEKVGNEHKITVEQHNPTRWQLYRYKDDKVYKYNIEEKKLEIDKSASWRLPEDNIGRFW
jgi:hypothetical protein